MKSGVAGLVASHKWTTTFTKDAMYLLAMPFVDDFDVAEYHAVAAIPQAFGNRWVRIREL